LTSFSARGDPEVNMRRKTLLVVALLILGIFALAQDSASTGTLSPAAQELLKMARAGVGESVLLTYVRTSPTPFALSADDVLTLKAAGLPQSVIAEALSRNTNSESPASPAREGISQDQLFRIRFGYIFYQGEAYPYRNGLNPALQAVLRTDPVAQVDIHSFAKLQSASNVFSWGGLGLMLGGAVYGVATTDQGWSNADLNGGIVFGAIGAGLISAIIGGIVNHAAFINLYDGLDQYNRDLLAENSRR
jgi:hypothetical protein